MPSLTIVSEDSPGSNVGVRDDRPAYLVFADRLRRPAGRREATPIGRGGVMAAQLQFAALIGFAGLMTTAAFEDLRRLMIPNKVTIALCLLWPLYIMAQPSMAAVLGGLGCALIVFIAGALLFSRGYLGGGDVKLLAVATLWAGPAATPALLMLTGVLGGALALFLLMPPGAYIATLARAKLGPSGDSLGQPPGHPHENPVPYGIAIAGAAVIVVFVPHFH